MKPKKIYGTWVEWHGGECPVPPETMVEVKPCFGAIKPGGRADNYYWHHDGEDDDIVEYRTFTEEPDLEAAEKLLLNHGYIVTPPTKPLTFEDVTPMTEAPPKGAEYWFVDPVMYEGVFVTRFENNVYDTMRIKRRMAYLDKEDALIAARHIFGLKGGEL